MNHFQLVAGRIGRYRALVSTLAIGVFLAIAVTTMNRVAVACDSDSGSAACSAQDCPYSGISDRPSARKVADLLAERRKASGAATTQKSCCAFKAVVGDDAPAKAGSGAAACKPGCTKPCCAAKKAGSGAAACKPGCTKPCCAG